MEITIEGNIAEIEGLIKALRIRPETGPYTPKYPWWGTAVTTGTTTEEGHIRSDETHG